MKTIEKYYGKHRKKILAIGTIFLITLIVSGFFFLPSWIERYNSYDFVKVDANISHITRFDYLKVVISIISPILTFIVFRNTLRIQEAQRKEKKYEMTVTEFYKLLDIFSGIQDKEIDKIRNLKTVIEIDFEDNGGNSIHWRNNLLKSADLVFKEQAKEVGHYFRGLHRILKMLNMRLDSGFIDYEEYRFFIGILRVQITADEFFTIMINSLFAGTGFGLGIQMLGTGFFDGVDILKDLNIKEFFGINAFMNEDERKKEIRLKQTTNYEKITSCLLPTKENAKYREMFQKDKYTYSGDVPLVNFPI